MSHDPYLLTGAPDPQPDRRPRQGLTAVVCLLIGAVLGGAGVWFFAPARGTPERAQTSAVENVTEATTTTAPPAATRVPEPQTPPPTEPPARPADPGGIGPGVYLVGTDIPPGTYRTDGPDDTALGDIGICTWQRLSGTSGEIGDLIAGDVVQGPGIVTIEPSDTAFQTIGCQPWRPAG